LPGEETTGPDSDSRGMVRMKQRAEFASTQADLGFCLLVVVPPKKSQDGTEEFPLLFTVKT